MCSYQVCCSLSSSSAFRVWYVVLACKASSQVPLEETSMGRDPPSQVIRYHLHTQSQAVLTINTRPPAVLTTSKEHLCSGSGDPHLVSLSHIHLWSEWRCQLDS